MTPFGATTRCRAWPIFSAKTVAQNPGGSVMPPLSPAQAATGGAAALGSACADDNDPAANRSPMIWIVDKANCAAWRPPIGLHPIACTSPTIEAEGHYSCVSQTTCSVLL